jgi:ABC-type amino acid transport substrate-binding protein
LFTGYLPYVNDSNGKCVGIDCDIILKIANALGLKVKLEVMSFAAELQAVQQDRVDVGIGEVSWTAERAKVGIITDPVYYSSAALIQPVGSRITTITQMQGKQVGTLVGYNWIQALQKIPGVTVRTYQTADEVYSDVSNGRLQTGIIDAAADQYVKKIRPDLHFQSLPIQVSAADLKSQPDDATFLQNQQVFFLNKNAGTLAAAMNNQIALMHAHGEVAAILKKYGITDPAPFVKADPISSTNRQGVDRPKNWVAPSEG